MSFEYLAVAALLCRAWHYLMSPILDMPLGRPTQVFTVASVLCQLGIPRLA